MLGFWLPFSDADYYLGLGDHFLGILLALNHEILDPVKYQERSGL